MISATLASFSLALLLGQVPDAAAPASPAPAPEEGRQAEEKIRIAVMELDGDVPATVRAGMTGAMTQTLDELGPFRTLSTRDIGRMIDFESEKASLGCEADASCLAEIVGALGASYLVTGSCSQVGDQFLLQVQLIDVGSARVERREQRDHQGPPSGLIDLAAGAARALVRDLLEARAGTLVLSTNVEGATVLVDGRAVGVTPIAPLTLAGGTHRVELEKTGFITSAADVDIVQDVSSAVALPIVPSEEFRDEYARNAWIIRGLALTGLGLGAVALTAGAALFAGGLFFGQGVSAAVDDYNAGVSRTAAQYEALQGQLRLLSAIEIGSVVLVGASAALALAGVVTWLLGPEPGRYDD